MTPRDLLAGLARLAMRVAGPVRAAELMALLGQMHELELVLALGERCDEDCCCPACHGDDCRECQSPAERESEQRAERAQYEAVHR